MNNKWVFIAYAAAWIATSIAVCVGLCITHSAWCLWALLLPFGINISTE